MSRGTALLAARGVARSFGRTPALHPVELEIWDGEAVALVGPNGAGKSTLLSLLAGALEPSSGSIERRKGVRVGWAPQRPAQYGRLSARENLELFARLEGVSEAKEVADRYIGLLDLPDDGRLTAELSAGNQQRLNVAPIPGVNQAPDHLDVLLRHRPGSISRPSTAVHAKRRFSSPRASRCRRTTAS